MTELEKIKYAKMYIDKLANGINPLDNISVPEDEVINQVKVSRCLFYVSDILRQVIDNGGVALEKRKKEKLFSLPMEKRSKFEFSEKPIPISEIAKRVNAIKPEENMKNLPYGWITSWLIQKGLLEIKELEDGKIAKWPTELGQKAGITLEERKGINGNYYVTVYDREAQEFILGNLDVVIEARNNK